MEVGLETSQKNRNAHRGLVEFKLGGRCDECIEAVVLHGFESTYMLIELIIQTL